MLLPNRRLPLPSPPYQAASQSRPFDERNSYSAELLDPLADRSCLVRVRMNYKETFEKIHDFRAEPDGEGCRTGFLVPETIVWQAPKHLFSLRIRGNGPVNSQRTSIHLL
ncbi:unnamed protein product [Orchesella dallaii]|uniref:Uncharacterized protein n=1 Tax=Orchesella dallaii TaxID=48710 RepID=A0ABP1RQW0_9HEXA